MFRSLTLLSLAFSFFVYAADPVDEEISRLEKKLHELKLKEMNAEIKSQKEMFFDWQDYTSDLKTAEDYETQADKIEKRLQELRSLKESHRS